MRNMLKKVMVSVVAVALLLGVAAVPSQDAQAAKTYVEKMEQGEKTVCFYFIDGVEVHDKSVQCSNSNSKVIGVKANSYPGQFDITAKKAGTAVVTLKYKGETQKYKYHVFPKPAKSDAVKIKVGKKKVDPLKKYKKYDCAIAFYKKNGKNFKGTQMGVKINSSLKQMETKYKDCSPTDIEKDDVGMKILLKKMKVSGVTKYIMRSADTSKDERELMFLLNKKNKVKAVLVCKNFYALKSAVEANKRKEKIPAKIGGKEIAAPSVDIKVKGSILYANVHKWFKD